MNKDEKQETSKMSLVTKLAKIGKEIGRIEKTGKNNSYNAGYNFIEYAVVAGKIREKFEEYNLIIIPAVTDFKAEAVESKKGAVGYHYILKMAFTIVNGDDKNDTMTYPWLGEASDYGDKGVNKAETSATKYFLMRLFNISEKSDEDADSTAPGYSRIDRQNVKKQHIPVNAIVEKLKTLDSVEAIDDAVQKIEARYPLILDIDRVLIDKAVKQRKDELSAVDELPSDDELVAL